MASAEQFLNEAQYAFNNISVGESRSNRSNAARARSLCRKIIRKFPTSTEADSAQAILKRLGDETYTSKLKSQHRHSTEHKPMQSVAQHEQLVELNWSGLVGLISHAPKSSLFAVSAAVFILFAIFGAFILAPLVVLVFLVGPFKQMLNPEQSQKVNELIVRVNAYVEGRRDTRS